MATRNRANNRCSVITGITWANRAPTPAPRNSPRAMRSDAWMSTSPFAERGLGRKVRDGHEGRHDEQAAANAEEPRENPSGKSDRQKDEPHVRHALPSVLVNADR